ncbi:hypothetical protein EVAR_43451_1 [Eumeta japonica]|uniref:Uncharacterized protein n=1 Tax=Eumeta variegata TaxID=151549 RepID=A0A4C1YEG2_EUMVA|nr:hypothetical protein EVAR_43451_1 [Eumeta japonica]
MNGFSRVVSVLDPHDESPVLDSAAARAHSKHPCQDSAFLVARGHALRDTEIPTPECHMSHAKRVKDVAVKESSLLEQQRTKNV